MNDNCQSYWYRGSNEKDVKHQRFNHQFGYYFECPMSRVLIRKNAPPDSIKISGKIYTDTQMNKGFYEYLYFHSVCPNAYLWQ